MAISRWSCYDNTPTPGGVLATTVVGLRTSTALRLGHALRSFGSPDETHLAPFSCWTVFAAVSMA